MFATTTGKLRNRVELDVVSCQQARGVLVGYHYLHRARVGRQINYAVKLVGGTGNPLADLFKGFGRR